MAEARHSHGYWLCDSLQKKWETFFRGQYATDSVTVRSLEEESVSAHHWEGTLSLGEVGLFSKEARELVILKLKHDLKDLRKTCL